MTAVDPAATATRFRDTLADPSGFATLVELVPWAGPLSDAKAEKHLTMGRELAADARITGMTVTDNAGGHIKLSPLSLGRALVDMGARRAALHASGVGETDLAVQTEDGVKEAKNRRTVITLQP